MPQALGLVASSRLKLAVTSTCVPQQTVNNHVPNRPTQGKLQKTTAVVFCSEVVPRTTSAPHGIGAQYQRRVLARLIENISDEELHHVTKMAKDEMNRRGELSDNFIVISDPEQRSDGSPRGGFRRRLW